jgi:hypothetical protein
VLIFIIKNTNEESGMVVQSLELLQKRIIKQSDSDSVQIMYMYVALPSLSVTLCYHDLDLPN